MDKPNWKPQVDGNRHKFSKEIWTEQVSFVPDVDIDCYPPFVAGKPDGCWVKYGVGKRPTTKEGWERCVGMSLRTMLF